MGFQIVSGFSLWLLPLCFLFGAVMAIVLYYKNTSDDYPRKLVWILSLFRFFSASLIAFLLLSPMVKTLVRTTEKPTIVIGIDNSASVLLGPDSTLVSDSLLIRFNQLAENLGGDFELVKYRFGQKTMEADTIDFKDKQSDISSFFNQVNSRFYNRNLGAVIIATDGIYNAGTDPLYQLKSVSYPVFTVNLGDTTMYRDLLLKKMNYNRIAYKGNRFPVEILVQSIEAAGEAAALKIEHNGAEVFHQELSFSSDNQVVTVPVMLQADETGQQRYRVSIEPLTDETNLSNNSRDIFINVKENKQKIAIIANSPHPDLSAIEQAIGNSNNFETELFYSDNFTGKVSDYSLFILHQLPSATNTLTGLMIEISKQKKPVLFIMGNQSDVLRLNTLKTGLLLTDYKSSVNEALPVLNEAFPLFTTSSGLKKLLSEVPPLQSPFARYQLNNSAYVYSYQSIGNLTTQMPLIFFNQSTDRRTGLIAGEGIWKWRLTDYALNNSHAAFDELIGKMVQYLSVETEKSRFKVSWRNYYAENESIEFGATLFNESDELINDKPVSIIITGEDKKNYEFDFTATGEAYTLNAGNFPPGIYSFTAKVESGSGVLTQSGSYTITALNLEDMNTIANHRLLNSMASVSGGKSVYPDEIGQLAALLKGRADVKPVTYVRKRLTDLINFYPLLALVILLMATEWFIRKYNGSY
ncbi:MAG: hypothetical protein H6541_05565 [Lentimicrobiaceae bacterium]|nr:hypothetical protein [Lentimicrobiaceae bacterium]HPG33490.1 hypothetical protein [Lentimicrobium sp.]